jgi:GntR family transcriptional regulator
MYLQIMEQIRRRIATGNWQAGQELPSIRALAIELRISVITVKRAYFELERAGVIITRPGRGSFVSDNIGLSLRLHREKLDEHLIAAADIARQMGMSDDELVARARAIAEQERTQAAHESGAETEVESTHD